MMALRSQRALRIGRGLYIGCLIMLHPENSLYAANDSTDRTPYHSADRAGASITFIHAMRDTARHSLCVRGERNRERGNESACNQNLSLH
jgi:hypothetical protein